MRRRWKALKGIAFVFPSLLGVLVFYLVPFLTSLRYCFTSGIKEKKFVGLQHFVELFQNETYQLALGNTVWLIGVSLPLLFICSLIVALGIEKQLSRLKGLQSILLIPIAIPAATLVLVWQDLFAAQGVLSSLVGMKIDWLNSEAAPWIIVFLIVWKNLGYNVLLILSSLVLMPKEYEEAAKLDGAGGKEIACCIKIPYLIPVLFFTVVISLNNCFKIFREIYLLQGAHPQNKLYLLQHFMNRNFLKLNYERLTCSAVILYSFIFAIIFVLSRWQARYIKNNV